MTAGHGTDSVPWAFQNRTNPRQADHIAATSLAVTVSRPPRGYCGFGTVAGDSGTGSSAVVLGGALFCGSFAGGISVPAG
jgi:hypothetical protein